MELDWQPVWLTLKLATTTTLVLLILGTPLAWWLATSRAWGKEIIGSLVALPLVLPPTVLGFYLLLMLGPSGPIGEFTQALGLGTLPFTFAGLVVGSVIQLRGVENINRLVTTGLYAKVRHPFYLGFLFLMLGAVVYYGALLSLLPGLLGVAVILYWQRLEEEALEAQHGEAYREYRKQTWF